MFRRPLDVALCSLAVLALVVPIPSAYAAERLLCEWKQNPDAVGDRCPEFFWETRSQSAYRIIVSGSRDPTERAASSSRRAKRERIAPAL